VILPGSDAAVMRIKGTTRGFAVTTDGRGRHCFLDPRGGGAATVAEAYRNLSCVGAEPVAVTDCLNFGSPEKRAGYYQLAECIEGMSEACEVLGTPVVSGNVSLFNETDRGPIYPTPTVGMVGLFEDVGRHATPSFKREWDVVVLLVEFPVTLDGSEYLEIVHDRVVGMPRATDLSREKEHADFVRSVVSDGLVDTAHDASAGGLAVALAEMAVAGGIGMQFDETEIEPKFGTGRKDVGLFGEGGARLLVTVPEERWEVLQRALADAGIPYDSIARTGGDRFKIGDLVDLSLDDLRAAYEQDLFGIPGEVVGGSEAVG
jgi:phosphoribosylformylglycinamidine synthase